MTDESATRTSEADYDELRRRIELINRCSELVDLATSAENALVRENQGEASDDLHELQDRLEALLEDVDEEVDRDQ